MTLGNNFVKLSYMFAVIKTGGKQYLVQPGDKIKVEKLEKEDGKEITFSEVLLCWDARASRKAGDPVLDKNKHIEIGTPLVKGATVTAKVLGQVKGEKLIIFKYKPKKRYKRKIGHRQKFTEVEILGIDAK